MIAEPCLRLWMTAFRSIRNKFHKVINSADFFQFLQPKRDMVDEALGRICIKFLET